MELIDGKFKRSRRNSTGRWAAVGPYYAMFPLEFAFDVIYTYSKEGDLVLDPFAGRASSVYAAATQKRHGLGIEINEVGWVYAQAKLNPAPSQDVEERLISLVSMSEESEYSNQQPEFFQLCYSQKVLNFLLTARDELKWKVNQVDCSLMAFLLIYLHAKLGDGLSNQMHQTKSMGPKYSVNWWKERELKPPDIELEEFFLQRIRNRYAKGVPTVTPESKVEHGDSTQILPRLVEEVNSGKLKRCSLLFTSPPYQGVTSYYNDQWLRLWLLGGKLKPEHSEKDFPSKYSSKESYRDLLDSVFKNVSKIMSEDSIIYVRTSARKFTFDTTEEILRQHFPSWELEIKDVSSPNKTQTHLFGDFEKKPGDKDIILHSKN